MDYIIYESDIEDNPNLLEQLGIDLGNREDEEYEYRYRLYVKQGDSPEYKRRYDDQYWF